MACPVQSKRAMPLPSSFRRLSRSLAVFLFAAITFCAGRAHAENKTPDSVLMKNGKIFRGTLELAEVDASFFRMTLADGKVITIPSTEVVRIERVVPDDSVSSVSTADNSEPANTGDVHVTFIADEGVTLQQRDGKGDQWRAVCRGKCEVSLPLDTDYRVGGGDVRPSNVFRLAGKDGDRIVLRTKAHSRGVFGLGITFVTVGSLATMISLSAMGNCDSYECDSSRAAGGVAALISAGLTVLGTVLIATNPSSKVIQKLQSGEGSFLAQSSPRPRLERGDASVATAAWHPSAPSFAPAPHTSTLFTIHF